MFKMLDVLVPLVVWFALILVLAMIVESVYWSRLADDMKENPHRYTDCVRNVD